MERMTERRPLEGRVVAVTGAGAGLGRAYAQLLAHQGALVVANDLHETQFDDGIHAHTGDISTEEGAKSLVETAVKEFGRLDALVNNAGVLRSGLILRISVEDWDVVHRVHLRGTFLTTQAAASYWREMSKAGNPVEAAIINTTSAAGLYGFVAEAAYSAAKAGIAGFTTVAAAELDRYGVTVNAIAPVARTQMTESWAGESAGEPVQDPLAPEHVAPVVAWLAGLDSRDVTGRVFEVGNGTVAVVDGWRPAATTELPLTDYSAESLIRPLLEVSPDPISPIQSERL